MLETVKNLCGDHLSQMTTPEGDPVQVAYVFQDFTSDPDVYSIPAERTKPSGTVHVALCAPSVLVDKLIGEGKLSVSVLSTDAVWFGVTYQEDRPVVAAALKALHDGGTYPKTLK